MALSEDTRPYGLKDCKVKLWTAGALGAAVDLPVANTFKFKEAESSAEFEGDDRLVGIGAHLTHVEWELEADGISMAALAVIAGGTVTDSGTTPTQKKRYVNPVGNERPYFLIEGQAISESGGDLHARVYKCKCKDVDPGGAEKSGRKTSYKGVGVAVTSAEATAVGGSAAVDECYDFVKNEGIVAIS